MQRTHLRVLGLLALVALVVGVTGSTLTVTSRVPVTFLFWLLVIGIFVRHVAGELWNWRRVLWYSLMATVVISLPESGSSVR